MGGIDEEIKDVDSNVDNVLSISEQRPRRRPFHVWKIRDKELKLKLTAGYIEMVERKYGGKNILTLVASGDSIPGLSVMLTVIQAAALTFQHSLSYADVQRLYDSWAEDGGSQTELFKDVIMPLLAVSGFFPEKQAAEIIERIEKESI